MWDPEVTSTIAGYLSIACWLVVFIPQLWENYQRKSGDGLSMTFLAIWLAGDLFNVVGVILQDLLPTMFLLGLWYTIADMGLIWQVVFYQRLSTMESLDEEEVSLIQGTNGQRRWPNRSKRHALTYWFNVISLLLVVLVTVVSCVWYASVHGGLFNGGAKDVNPAAPLADGSNDFQWLPQFLGWTSAILYVGSRIPQILKNYRERSTEGLSVGMFLCAVLGNLLFTLSIFLRSTDPHYLLINLSWIVGSSGTLLFDFTIFVQFFLYNQDGPTKKTRPLAM